MLVNKSSMRCSLAEGSDAPTSDLPVSVVRDKRHECETNNGDRHTAHTHRNLQTPTECTDEREKMVMVLHVNSAITAHRDSASHVFHQRYKLGQGGMIESSQLGDAVRFGIK